MTQIPIHDAVDASQKAEHSDPNPVAPLLVVGIGASAGGLEALERLFASLPTDTGIAFVVVQHLSPDFKSVMDELLRRHTAMPIFRVEDGMPVEANCVYLIPPKKEMIISAGRLLLTERDPQQDLSLPIDHFLRSLAHEVGSRAVAVVLSGTGSDGSRGVRDVHEAGGLVLVQRADTAKFDGMPRSAMDTGCADAELSPEEMPGAMVERARRIASSLSNAASKNGASPGENALDVLFKLLLNEYGIDFSLYKTNTVGRRIDRRLSFNQLNTIEEYVDRLRHDPVELNALYHDMLIGVTRFFRDPDAFMQLERKVLPELLARKEPASELRIWVAGCATGEEAYSLAILLHEWLQKVPRPPSAKIFATDVHMSSLERAGLGVYEEEALAEVSPERLATYFRRKGDGYHVIPLIREMIVFARHNIIRDAPFTKMDLITCRNLLIYFQPPIQKKIVSLFHFGLRTGGCLFLGPSEGTGELSPEFETLDERWKLYRKRRDIRFPPDLRLPVGSPRPPIRVPVPSAAQPTMLDGSLMAAYDRLLETHVPPGLLVNDQRQLVHAFRGAGRYLRNTDGRPSADILDRVDGNLKLALAGLMARVAKEYKPMVYGGVRIGPPESQRRHTVTVSPILNRQGNITHYFIALEPTEIAPAARRPDDPELDVNTAVKEQLYSLEGELRHAREDLQATIEELETSNEELQASNEELVASNEELQSTNEELHSVNEELYTVNAEYQKKIMELSELTEDMDNLLRNTDVAVIFIDKDMHIRKFTPQIAKVFDLLPQDVGRRIESFAHHLVDDKLLEHVSGVIEKGVPFEKQVQDKNGTWYFLRILPYRSNVKTEGVVLTLFDIAVMKRSEQEARDGVRRRDQFLAMLSHELRNPLAAILNAARLLETEADDPQSLELSRGTIRRQAGHMARLLDDLLDVSRITRDKIEIRHQPVDLRTVTRDAVEAIQPFAASRGIQMHIELPGEPICINGDPARLQQIEVNLLNNAVRYTPSRGQVWLRLSQDKGMATIAVRDTGIGIPKDMQESIFDLFVQLGRDHEGAAGGMGVGLTLVRALVSMHGGTVSVHSEGSGKGSEFVVRLPASDVAELQPVKKDTPRPLRGLHVLVIEDNDDIRSVMHRVLKRMGCEVMVAPNGLSGIESLGRHRPDVALVDIGLPEIDGYEVARRMRQMPKGDEIRLIAVTGFGQPDDRQRALEAGFDAHLVKPVDLEQLHETLAKLVK